MSAPVAFTGPWRQVVSLESFTDRLHPSRTYFYLLDCGHEVARLQPRRTEVQCEYCVCEHRGDQ